MSEQNKQVVRRFNQQVIAEGNRQVFDELVDDQFINHTAPPGMASDKQSLWNTFDQVLRPAISQLEVSLELLVAENDIVSTRKTIRGYHSGTLGGVEATGLPVVISVFDMVQIRDGRYIAHWGLNNLPEVIRQLQAAAG
ncbi:ester cyclase [Tatumella sp. UBA2305]|uniref:ester cyclase n=1 Tax=Tatumella sp. UBA2305 TaxID=1947647 RepID=UPI0025E4ECF9|nr:ester cyclase [Tatumella sp. UBA2305]